MARTVFYLVFGLFFLLGCKQKEKALPAPVSGVQGSGVGGKKMSASEKLTRLFVEANKQKIIGNYKDAEDLFLKCTVLDPENDASYFELSKIYVEAISTNALLVNDLLKKSLAYGDKALKIDPNNKWYLEHMVYLYEATRQYDKAILALERLLVLFPMEVNYVQSLAVFEEAMGNYKKALEYYNDLEKKTTRSKQLAFSKASLWIRLGDLGAAEQEIERMIEVEPKEIDLYQKLAEIQLKRENNEVVLKTFERMKAIDPGNGLTNLALANYYKQKGEKERAYDEILLAFKDSNVHIDNKVMILLDYYTLMETDSGVLLKEQSFNLVRTLMEVHPRESKSYAIAGDFYVQQDDKQAAAVAFKKATELDGSRFVMWNQLLVLQAQLEQYDSLIATAKKVVELFPTQPIPYYFAGIAYNQKKEYAQVVEWLENGLAVVLDKGLKVQFYALLGDAYNALNLGDKSNKAFEDALVLESDNAGVLNNYAYYLSERKESLDKAKAMSKKSLELEPESATFADTYAWILFRLGDYKGAETWILKAVSEKDASGVVVEHYGDILFHLNQLENAVKQWEIAKKLGGASKFIDQKIEEKRFYE